MCAPSSVCGGGGDLVRRFGSSSSSRSIIISSSIFYSRVFLFLCELNEIESCSKILDEKKRQKEHAKETKNDT